MTWNRNNYPSEFDKLDYETKTRAIGLLNILVTQLGINSEEALQLAVKQATIGKLKTDFKGSRLNFHVFYDNPQWFVSDEQTTKPIKAFAEKKEAIRYAKIMARTYSSQAIIRKRDGTVQDILSFYNQK